MVCIIIPIDYDIDAIIMSGVIKGDYKNAEKEDRLPIATEIHNIDFAVAEKLPIWFDISHSYVECSRNTKQIPKMLFCLGICATLLYFSYCSKCACNAICY